MASNRRENLVLGEFEDSNAPEKLSKGAYAAILPLGARHSSLPMRGSRKRSAT